MQKKWRYGILGYVFWMIGLAMTLYTGKLLLQLSTELVEASLLYHSDDLLHYSFELHEIYWWWMVTVLFIFTIAFGFFIGSLIEK